MSIPSWAFALLRFGVIALLYMHFGHREDLLAGEPLLFYGLPFFMLLAVLGIHRYWMFALGTLMLCASFGDLAPASFQLDRSSFIGLGIFTFFLGFTPCDRDYSVRGWWNKNDDDFFNFKAAPDLSWNLYRGLTALFYFQFLLTKTNPGYFQGQYFSRHFSTVFYGAEFLVQPAFISFCIAAALISYALNVGFIVAVWFPQAFRALVALAVPFHLVHMFITGFRDITHLMFLLLLLPFAMYGKSGIKTSNVLTYT